MSSGEGKKLSKRANSSSRNQGTKRPRSARSTAVQTWRKEYPSRYLTVSDSDEQQVKAIWKSLYLLSKERDILTSIYEETDNYPSIQNKEFFNKLKKKCSDIGIKLSKFTAKLADYYYARNAFFLREEEMMERFAEFFQSNIQQKLDPFLSIAPNPSR